MLVKELYTSAPSFVNFIIQSSPFRKNNSSQLYIKAQNPSTKTIRDIKVSYLPSITKEKELSTLKKIRGFADGPIKVVSTRDKDFLERTPQIRFATDVSYYIISSESIPSNVPLPLDFKIKNLTWEEFQSCEPNSHKLL